MFKPVILLLVGLLIACQPVTQSFQADKGRSSASAATLVLNQAVKERLPLENEQDNIDAKRGLIAQVTDLNVMGETGEPVWDMTAYDFVKGEAPGSVNPSLWRQEKLNNVRGLFKVTERVYQLRGFDFANMTIMEGDSGWIIVDPLTAKETAQAALAFARQHLPVKPIRAIIFTHAHMDHFGGVLGIVSPEQVAELGIRIIAPGGFMEAATSENIIAGVAMSRRATYMYGKDLPRSALGHVGSGLGTGPAFGTFGILEPTELINEQTQQLNIDGLEFVFQNVSGTESVAEVTFYLPQLKAFAGAELVSRNMHNLYTLRGAEVRDALKWSNKIDEARILFREAEIYFGSHHWPVWGQDNVQNFLSKQRDLYKHLHDQSVRLMNQGLNGAEIAEKISLPEELSQFFANRGYYGSLRHNAKAVYQYYMGWFDANPAHLNPLPQGESAPRYIAMMGGAEQVMKSALASYDRGEYRWVAELLNRLIFADADHQAARQLLAKTYSQLAYQAESAPWRNFYLTGAQELISGVKPTGINLTAMEDILRNTPVTKFFDSMAVRLNSEKAAGKQVSVAIHFTDLEQSYRLELSNSVLRHYPYQAGDGVDSGIYISHALFVKLLIGKLGIRETLFSDDLSVEGNILDLVGFFMLFDKPDGLFNIVSP